MFARLEEMRPRSEAMPESGSNTAYRHTTISNVIVVMTWVERIAKKNVLSLPKHVLTEDDYAASLG